jgi:hypothetical protein
MCICHIHLALIKLYVDMLSKVIQFFMQQKSFSAVFFYNNLFSPPWYMRERSSIAVICLSIHTTPVEMREKLAVAEELWPCAISELTGLNHIEDAAELGTYNRMELCHWLC